MRQRVISSLVGLLILGATLAVINTKFFNVIIAAVSMMALFEMLRATKCTENKGLTALSFLTSLIIPFGHEHLMRVLTVQMIFILFLLFFVLLIKNSETTRVEQAAMAFMFGIFIPLFFSCAVFLRDIYGYVAGSFYLLTALGSAWLSDTGAYFVGRKFGRHKLAPVVSPKKTVEGAIGGLIFSTFFMQLIAIGFYGVMAAAGIHVKINYGLLALLTPVCSIFGMLGDLAASVIKRQFDVKDYGTIMPGHGGVMDRFDSVLFTLPAVFIIAHHVSVISII